MATRNGWGKAMDAAWREFGRKNWRALVGVSMAGKALPAVAVAALLGAGAYGVVWVVRHAHLPHAPHLHLSFGWMVPPLILAAAILVVSGALFAAWRWWNPEAVLTRPRVASVLVLALTVAALWAWRRT